MAWSEPTSELERTLSEKLALRNADGKFRQLTITPQNATVDFSSNDFLSLSSSPLLRSRFLKELSKQPDAFRLGSGGSRLLDGNSQYADDLEQSIAAFHNASAGLLWNSGYDANAGVFGCIPQTGDVIVYDELIHASVHEGMKLSRAAKRLTFAHNSVESLSSVLRSLLDDDERIKLGRNNVIVAVESVYSMDGDVAPLAEIVRTVNAMLPAGNGHVIVDEAHATGVLGPNGRGLVCELELEQSIFARLHTFGKGLGTSGAIVLCSPLVRSYLINYARPLIYTTFMSFPSLAAIRSSYWLLKNGHTENALTHLKSLIRRLHDSLSRLILKNQYHGEMPDILTLSASCPRSPIFSLLTRHPRSLALRCQKAGFVVRAIVPPTVPTQRVRICLHAGNSVAEVEGLICCIERWVEETLKSGQEKHDMHTSKAKL